MIARHIVLMVFLVLWALIVSPEIRSEESQVPPEFVETEDIKLFRIQSELLTVFWGREMYVEAGVVLPPDREPGERFPVLYHFPGFGGSGFDLAQTYVGPWLLETMRAEARFPRMIYVYPKMTLPMWHHGFADSANTGPWASALVTEFIPALEQKFGGYGDSEARFVTGHSSGGWTSLWLQVAYPEVFGGAWSTAPDSIDFRSFGAEGVNIYEFESMFIDPEGKEIKTRDGTTARQFLRNSRTQRVRESFEAMYSPRGDDGRPMKLVDRETGVINREVAKAWQKYDISLILRERWEELASRLKGKLHIYVGTLDEYRLDEAVKLVKAQLEALDSDAEVLLVKGRDHIGLWKPHPELWPQGMWMKIYRDIGTHIQLR